MPGRTCGAKETSGIALKPNAPTFGEAIVRRLDALAAITDEPGQLTRLYLSPAHKRAADVVAGWMRGAGMSVRLDSVGSVIGRYEGMAGDAPALLLGSHIDTVRNGGRYDGTLGVLAAIAAVEQLHTSGRRLPFAIEVLAFGDEEGIRFPGTLTGSRALAGRFEQRLLEEVDRDGLSRRQALIGFGCEVSRIAGEARDPKDILGYLEVHIEQGPVLEAEELPVAVVTAINGATRGKVTVTSPPGHAGTVPMRLRHDAMAAAAEMILAIESRAAGEADLVATVGLIEVVGGAVNAVPGTITFTIDVRSPADDQRKAAVTDIEREVTQIAERRGVDAAVALTYEAPSAICDPGLTAALSTSIGRAGLKVRELPSGAGHDAMSFRDSFPFAMLFVRCRGGISHNPDEFATLEDIDVAARILADCVATFDPDR